MTRACASRLGRRAATAERELRTQAPYEGGLPAPPVALYVHVPFCISICPYCDFVVYAGATARGARSRVATFLEALITEIRLRADDLDARFGPDRPALASLYLGGGTPSLLPADEIARLVELVRDRYGLAADAEVTLEANPGGDERGDASALRRAGVTRLSIGAQSLDPAELRRLGRRHRPEDVAETIAAGRAAGIASVSVDLLYDVPGQSVAGFARTLEAAVGLDPDHLSAYALALDDPDAEGLIGPSGDHIPLRSGARRWREAARLEQDDDRAAEMYEHLDRSLSAAGYGWYEISNWARPGHASRHNNVYWARAAYEAVGPGAHAFDGEVRRWNAARLDAYLAALVPAAVARAPELPPGGVERIDSQTAAAEIAILGLRTAAGISAEVAAAAPARAVLPWAIETGLVERVGAAGGADQYALTRRGRLLSNEVFARLV